MLKEGKLNKNKIQNKIQDTFHFHNRKKEVFERKQLYEILMQQRS